MLRQELMTKREGVRVGRTEATLLSVMSVFCLITLVKSAYERNALYILSSIASLVLIFAPLIAESLFQFRISLDLKLVYMALAMCGPMLGNVYKCYYTVPYWDKALHTLSGMGFAVLGYILPDLIDKQNESHSSLLKCVCAFCFSLTVAALWEFFEYGADTFFQADMQNDTIITGVSSYALGGEVGVIGSFSDITSVTVNGEALPFNGYLDIGLIDTMNDMLVCALGATAFCIYASTRRRDSKLCRITLNRDMARNRAA